MLPKYSFLPLVLRSMFSMFVLASSDLAENMHDKLEGKYIAKEDAELVKCLLVGNESGYGTEWIIMPDGNGTSRITFLSTTADKDIFKMFGGEEEMRFGDYPVEENVHFKLFTKNNPQEGEDINPNNLASSHFDGSRPTKIVIHGWQSSIKDDIFTSIRNAYLLKSNVNVIGVDWSNPASNIFYGISATYIRKAGKYVARLVDELVESKGARYKDIHLVGHSLGAHTAGIAGHFTKRKVFRITGLDPAMPNFLDSTELQYKLDESDAEFVEVIHTCAGILGLVSPLGHADFYPNGGSPFQPGCCCFKQLMHVCSHGRSYKYFSESILFPQAFEGKKCPSWNVFKNNSCKGTTIPMGEYTPTNTRGTFYLQTNSEYPFGLGNLGTKFHSK